MSTLQTFNSDKLLERLRERAEERGYDIDGGYCSNCDCKLTESDLDNEACTNCLEPLAMIDPVGDDLPNEDLEEDDGLGDY